MTKMRVTSIPANGTLYLDDTPQNGVYDVAEALAINDEITKTQIDANQFRYFPLQDEFGASYTSFNFQVYDGADYSAAASIIIDVTEVNDDPTIETIADQVTNEGFAIAGISFIVDEGGGLDENVQVLIVTATSNDQTLVPDGNITINYTDNGAGSAD